MNALLLLLLSQGLASEPDLRDDLERAAEKLKYFPTGDVLYDRLEKRFVPKDWFSVWQATYGQIAAGKGTQREKVALLRHVDPKVRTLALAFLFHAEDPQNLRHIASLLGDTEATLPTIMRVARIDTKPVLLPEEIQPQTVGQVAEAMLRMALEPSGYPVAELDKYLESRKHRTYWASWYNFRMMRAYQGTTPFQKNRTERMKALRQDIDRLPQPDRDWILLSLAGQYNHVDHKGVRAALITPAELADVGKRLGSERLLDLVQGRKINDDPDLAPDHRRSRAHMAIVAVMHAKAWFRPEDAPALLAAEKVYLPSPWYAIGAAELQPDNAEKWLRQAMERFGQKGWDRSWDRGEIAAALWRIKGDSQLDYVVDWIYKEEGNRRVGQTTAVDIFADANSKMPEAHTKKLVKRIVSDPRFEEVPFAVLRQAILMANRHSKEEIVAWRDLYDGWTLRPATSAAERQTLAAWRAKLKAAASLWQ